MEKRRKGCGARGDIRRGKEGGRGGRGLEGVRVGERRGRRGGEGGWEVSEEGVGEGGGEAMDKQMKMLHSCGIKFRIGSDKEAQIELHTLLSNRLSIQLKETRPVGQ